MDDNNLNQPHPNYNQGAPAASDTAGDTAVMSTKDWLLTFLALMIPCAGIILYFVWAFGSTGNLNRRNYCRAYLIFAAIVTVVLLIFYGLIFAAIFAAIGTMDPALFMY